MDYIGQIETFLSIQEESFEIHLSAIRVLGEHRIRSEVVRNTKQMLQALLRHIEVTEGEIAEEIEAELEEILDDSASVLGEAIKAEAAAPDVELLKELHAIAANGHNKATAMLADEEERATAEVARRFADMKRRVGKLLSRIETA